MLRMLSDNDSVKPERPTPADFDIFLPWACAQMGAEFTIIITKNVQTKYLSAIGKDKARQKSKQKVKTLTDSGSNASDLQIDSKTLDEMGENPIYMETTYDENNDLVRLKLLKNKFIKNKKNPRLLFQVIGLTIPYHKTFTSLIVNDGLHAEAIHEISLFYSTNQITEICLDNTNFPEANYHILLDNNRIKHLSLSKCNITDVVVKTIASKLAITSPASTSLSVLNLSTNRITDVGVKYLAEMLRSNRKLCYLNLANNKITDEGAKSIFNILTKFALTSEEILDSSWKRLSYLREKNELILRTIKEFRCGDDKKNIRKKSARVVPPKKKLEKEVSVDMKSYYNFERVLFERAETIAEGILGPFNNPFRSENIEKGESVIYCLGNNTLSYLNLAFNDLSYCSVKKLCDVLKTQKILSRKPKGLINIRIEGNYLPVRCTEFQTIDDLLLPGLSKAKNVESVKKRGVSSPNRIIN